MKYAIRSKMMSLAVAGLMVSLLPAGAAWGAGCVSAPNDPSLFSLLIDATSSCASMSSNMTGCAVDASGQCTMTNPKNSNEHITVSLTDGSVGSASTFSWSATSNTTNPKAGTVDFSIMIGATGGGTCGWSYSPGSSIGVGTGFLKSNGSYQKINDIYFCSDFEAPPAAVPRLTLKKTVMAKGGACGVDDVDILDAKTGTEVEYCYMVENLGNGKATSVVLIDDNATPTNETDDYQIDLHLSATELAPGGTARGKSPYPVMLTVAGKLMNTAKVTGDSEDNSYVSTATDTAVVNVTQSLVACPPDFQKAVDKIYTENGDFAYAMLLNPRKPQDEAICVPSSIDENNTGELRVRGTDCIDECVIKPGCDTDPTADGCAPQVCQHSGVWPAPDASDNNTCKVMDNTPGKLPYCWEVEQDLNGDCELNKVEPMKTHEVTTKEIHSNPYVYQSCVKSGGSKTCTTYCYLYPGETASVCPKTSIIIQ